MKLQLALDRLTWHTCFDILEDVHPSVDIIEVGTGVIKEYGMEIIREIRRRYPSHHILADMKTCDAGKHEAQQAFGAGADITTVMAFSAPATIRETMNIAEEYGGRVMIDLLEVQQQAKLKELQSLNVSLVALHVGKDRQKEGVFNTELFKLVEDFPFEVAVAGGMDEYMVKQAAFNDADIVIVGSAITNSQDPSHVVQNIRQNMKG